jgi:phage gp16-like protein
MTMNPADEAPRVYGQQDRRTPSQNELIAMMQRMEAELSRASEAREEARRDRAEVRAEVAEIRAIIKPMAEFMAQKSGAAWAARTSAAVFLFLVAVVGALGGALSFFKMHFSSAAKP